MASDRTQAAEFAARVACWLPAWRFDSTQDSWWAELIGEGGMRLEFRAAWNKNGMVTVYGKDAGHPSPSINVSLSRDPRAAAADIERRLLPDYFARFEAERERKAVEAERQNKVDLIAGCFERLGLERSRNSCSTHEIMLHGFCRATVHYHGDCRLEVSLPADLAIKLAGFIKQLHEESA